MAADNNNVVWKVSFQGKQYEVTTNDLTLGRLRQAKAWFGKEYGSFQGFVLQLGQGDVDAIATALWIARTKAHETGVKTPVDPEFDFSFDDFEAVDLGAGNDDADGGEGDPTPEPPATPTRGSSKTSKP